MDISQQEQEEIIDRIRKTTSQRVTNDNS